MAIERLYAVWFGRTIESVHTSRPDAERAMDSAERQWGHKRFTLVEYRRVEPKPAGKGKRRAR